jgi:class 3 adenylate cyclase
VAVLAAAALSAAIAVPLATVGDADTRLSKPTYSQRVTAIYRRVGQSFQHAGSPASRARTSASLRTMKRALDRAASALASLPPPRDAEREHRVIVASTHDYAAQVDLLRASVDFGDPVTIASHLREVTAPRQIQRALGDLVAKGYRIPVTVVALS